MSMFCLRIRYSSRSSGPLEGPEEDLQRVRRDIEVLRQLGDRLAVDQRQLQRHPLGGGFGWRGVGVGRVIVPHR